MEKTIEQANKSLLRKRQENQKHKPSVLQSLRLKIKEGRIREARRKALKHLQGEYVEEILEMFEKIGPSTFTCQKCKCTTAYRFNPVFLAYDTNQRTCSTCATKIEKAIAGQKLSGKTKALERFKAKQEQMIDDMIAHAGVPVLFRKACMKDLEDATAKALSTDQSYFIKGDVGVGKSHMAVALMRAYLTAIKPEYNEQRREYYLREDELIRPVFIEVPELLLGIRDAYNGKSSASEKEIVEYYTLTPFLVLDDLGSEKASEFSTLMIYLIINRRCTQNKTTIITSNLDLEQIRDRLSDRISSRIKGMCREITVAGNDKRYENKAEHSKKRLRQH